MQFLRFLTALSLYLQFAWTSAFEDSEDNRNSDNDKTVALPLILVYGGFHYAVIGIGTPPQTFKVFFDTWNQNSWITSTKCPQSEYAMCRFHYKYNAKKSRSSKETTEEFSYVEYGTTVNGTITEDIVKLGNQYANHPFGEVKATDGKTLNVVTFDGSFGIGFGSTETKQRTILQSMVNSGVINKQVFGIYAKSNANGEIMFGGYNESLYNGELEFVDVSSKQAWMFFIKSIMFGDEDLTGKECQGVVNDGSHHIYGPKEQVEKIYKKLGCDPSKLCEVNCSKISTLPQLKIIVKTTEIIIGPENYIDKEGDTCTGRIFDLDQPTWVLGNLFLDKVYTAYDVEHAKIGFALAGPPSSTLSPTPSTATTRSTTTTTTTTTATTTSLTTITSQPNTTSAAPTLPSHHKSVRILTVMAVWRYLQMLNP
ncbi:unnamed protein product [Calicophoron daubneyi]|uniref:Peptidase A1 domain-containing protein n=1 Tax=Calicophoron daubneyi TaxID=300641 RepID=A0AAV2TP07_CALDB